MAEEIDLYDFMQEAELVHYYSELKIELQVETVSQLMSVDDDDLGRVGMTAKEIEHMRKCYKENHTQGYFARLKKFIFTKKNKNNANLQSMLKLIRENLPLCTTSHHIIPACDIDIFYSVSSGEFGIVQKGVWKNKREKIPVAVKILNQEQALNNPEEFLKEAVLLHSFDNEYIVRFFGVVLNADAMMLVTEFAPFKSLIDCFKEPSYHTDFTVITLCDFAVQICRGMDYLEKNRYIHRDLAARNILVFTKTKVKISDFGLSRKLDNDKDYYQINFHAKLKLPLAWCAPECLSHLRFTSSSDVWAYGVTLWEMFSYGLTPWAEINGHEIFDAINAPNFQRLKQPDCCPKEYFDIMTKCWQHDPTKRPKFSDLLLILPYCTPEQVLTKVKFEDKNPGMLQYTIGEVITVINKTPGVPNLWKGVLCNRETGLFNPSNTVAIENFISLSNQNPKFTRKDSKYVSRRSHLTIDMISGPQGDVKHIAHVGADGARFGELLSMGSSTPKVVASYNYAEDRSSASHKPISIKAYSSFDKSRSKKNVDNSILLDKNVSTEILNDHEYLELNETIDNSTLLDKNVSTEILNDHEYLELNETIDNSTLLDKNVSTEILNGHEYLELNEIIDNSTLLDKNVSTKIFNGHEYLELNETSDEDTVSESSRFETISDFESSLAEELETVLSDVNTYSNCAMSPPMSPLDTLDQNYRNELRQIGANIDAANLKSTKKQPMLKPISASDEKSLDSANELANCSKGYDIEKFPRQIMNSPSPSSPSKQKLAFRFPLPAYSLLQTPKLENKSFTDEAASIPNIRDCLTEEAKEAYTDLIERPSTFMEGVVTTDSLRIFKKPTNPTIKPTPRLRNNEYGALCSSSINNLTYKNHAEKDSDFNVLPLLPKNSKTLQQLTTFKPKHQRNHSVVMPSTSKGGPSCKVMPVTSYKGQLLCHDRTITHDPENKNGLTKGNMHSQKKI